MKIQMERIAVKAEKSDNTVVVTATMMASRHGEEKEYHDLTFSFPIKRAVDGLERKEVIFKMTEECLDDLIRIINTPHYYIEG